MAVEAIRIQDRATWLQLRTQDLTASDIAAVAGVDHRRTPLAVWAEKVGLVPGTADNVMMRRGRWLEPAVVEAMRERHPTWTIKRSGVYLRDPDLRMGATPDAIAEDPERKGIGAIQCKVVSRPIYEAEWEDGRAPLKFEIQTLSEAMLLEAEWAVVAALVIGTYSAELVEHEVPRHVGAEDRIRGIVRTFWEDIAAGRQPRADYARDAETIDTLNREMRPGATVDLTGDNRMPALLAEREIAKAAEKAAREEAKRIEAEIAEKIGAAEEAILPGWKVTRRTQFRDEYVSPAVSFRRLYVKKLPTEEGPF